MSDEIRWVGAVYSSQPSVHPNSRKKKFRNEREIADGKWYAESYEPGETIEIRDLNAPVLATLIIGKTIVDFTREADTGESWPQGANSVMLTLDDGSKLQFSGWGYDASGLMTEYTPVQL